ncbi:MAG TPA: long-chain fatty acid--CoA ligase [Thermoleophilaceae bacterium]|nr:long-chain fatty acid--CoA ligase [Thermoleophilaceae bacterium]
MTVPAASTETAPTGIADLLPRAAAKHGSSAAVMFNDGGWKTRSFAEVGDTVRELAKGLMALGVEKGDKVSILANTRPEWSYHDFAALSAGATVVPIYQTNSPEECQYVLEDSDAKVVVVEDEAQLEKVRAMRDTLPKLEHVILMVGTAGDAISSDDLVERGKAIADGDWVARYESVTGDDICTFIYTSGTTGPPKGCVISHANYRAMVDMVVEEDVVASGDVVYLFLPLAHSFALLIQFAVLELGSTIAYWSRDPKLIIEDVAAVKPTYLPSVPRIFEKIYTKATAAEGAKKKILDWSIATGRKYREAERAGRSPGFLLERQYAIADKLALGKIRALFGGNVRLCVTGAAPISQEILEFFWAAGVLILEGYGMTETSTAASINRPSNFKFGTVGLPFPGVQVKIADDGEICVAGPNIFQGYHKKDDATRETLVDGWLHTGDLGEVDSDGFVKITGRKKDIIITAGGKNITPANFEGDMKQHALVSQCVMVGDRLPYLTALVTLDPEEAPEYAKAHDLPTDLTALIASPEVMAELERHMGEVNKKYAQVEQVKKLTILSHDLSQETGELTPTLKVKRSVVVGKYAGEIEAMYSK